MVDFEMVFFFHKLTSHLAFTLATLASIAGTWLLYLKLLLDLCPSYLSVCPSYLSIGLYYRSLGCYLVNYCLTFILVSELASVIDHSSETPEECLADWDSSADIYIYIYILAAAIEVKPSGKAGKMLLHTTCCENHSNIPYAYNYTLNEAVKTSHNDNLILINLLLVLTQTSRPDLWNCPRASVIQSRTAVIINKSNPARFFFPVVFNKVLFWRNNAQACDVKRHA